jgi:hypothetical protein
MPNLMASIRSGRLEEIVHPRISQSGLPTVLIHHLLLNLSSHQIFLRNEVRLAGNFYGLIVMTFKFG